MDPFVAEIRIFPFNFAPKGWAWCDGQFLPLSQNTALFSLLGTTYGGNGKSNFALPDLQGRAPMHPGQGPGLSLHDLGETGGIETVTLLESEIPAHTHASARSQADACGTPHRVRNTIAQIASGNRLSAVPQHRPSLHGSGSPRPRRRRPAAQQHAAVPDVLLLHRVARASSRRGPDLEGVPPAPAVEPAARLFHLLIEIILEGRDEHP